MPKTDTLLPRTNQNNSEHRLIFNTIYNELKKWMIIDTWDSSHPLDEERFHQAIKQIFSKLEAKIDVETFEEVMTDLANDLYPNRDSEEQSKTVKDYAREATNIVSYLYSTVKFKQVH